MPSPEQKTGKIDKLLKAGVYLNIVTVPFWIAVGRPDIALLDIGSGVLTEKARKKIKTFRGRNRLFANLPFASNTSREAALRKAA